MKCVVEMGSGGTHDIHRKFLKNGTDIQGKLRFCHSSLKGCNVGITDRREL
jgi:hypothetical protein